MEQECHRLLLAIPDNKVLVNQIFAQFVDDLATICNHSPNHTITQQTTNNIQLHNHLVNVTGGMLALDKCKVYLCQFHFDSDGNSHLYSKNDHPCSILVKDPLSGNMVPIRQLDPTTAHKNLG